ncbi:MAG TPA: hypothetical protein VN521_03600 [Negativicutes bacterium]|nr:hypothetical protein [Negativicutes bacterium]
MDNVGLPLTDATAALAAQGIAYTVTVTRPSRRNFPLAEEQLYVVRELCGPDGERRLLVAAKMGKAPS